MFCAGIWRCPVIWTGEGAMRFLDEHRRRPAALADHLPWAALVAPGVVLNKDGSFLAGILYGGRERAARPPSGRKPRFAGFAVCTCRP